VGNYVDPASDIGLADGGRGGSGGACLGVPERRGRESEQDREVDTTAHGGL